MQLLGRLQAASRQLLGSFQAASMHALGGLTLCNVTRQLRQQTRLRGLAACVCVCGGGHPALFVV
jgi:hypothetical protein